MSIQQLVYTLRTWLVPFRYGLERWSYTLQRVSGVAITLFFVAHIVQTGNVVGGASVWSIPPYELAKKVWMETEAFLANPLFDIGLSVLGFLIFFHAFNGVRLFLAHFGIILKKPSRPEYPYRPGSMSQAQRALFWVTIVLAVAALVYALDVFFEVLRL
jgi:succinate dehydrogenase / fumarate reductase cytochrome b subunit